MMGALVFFSCSDDDNEEEEDDCVTCTTNLIVTFTSEHCDNGDGTVTVTQEDGSEEVVDLMGSTFEEYINGIAIIGTTCE